MRDPNPELFALDDGAPALDGCFVFVSPEAMRGCIDPGEFKILTLPDRIISRPVGDDVEIEVDAAYPAGTELKPGAHGRATKAPPGDRVWGVSCEASAIANQVIRATPRRNLWADPA